MFYLLVELFPLSWLRDLLCFFWLILTFFLIINFSILTFYFLKFIFLQNKTKNKEQVSKMSEFKEFLHQFSHKSVIMKLVANVNTKHRLISLLAICFWVFFLSYSLIIAFYKHRSLFENRFGLSNKVNNFLLCGIFFFKKHWAEHRICYLSGSEPNLLRSQLPCRTLRTFIGHTKWYIKYSYASS